MEKQTIKSGFVGLFWYDNETSGLVDCVGEVEFSYSDLVRKETILPRGVHRSYGGRSSYTLPRGRVEVEDGKIIISIGLLGSSLLVNNIIAHFGLEHFRSVVEVRRNKFWDKRMD